MLRQAVARPQEGASTFVTGGDVSRFERSLQPKRQADGTPPPPPPPVVRVSRGNSTSTMRVGRGRGVLVEQQAEGVNAAGDVATVGLSTLR